MRRDQKIISRFLKGKKRKGEEKGREEKRKRKKREREKKIGRELLMCLNWIKLKGMKDT